jgi:hypothetical protein
MYFIFDTSEIHTGPRKGNEYNLIHQYRSENPINYDWYDIGRKKSCRGESERSATASSLSDSNTPTY